MKLTEGACRKFYGSYWPDRYDPTWKVVLCTAVIIIGSVLLEFLVHMSWEHRNKWRRNSPDVEQLAPSEELLPEREPVTEQPQREEGLQAEPVLPEMEQQKKIAPAAPASGYMFCCASDPTPQSRAKRLAFAFVVYPFILAAFIVRINSAISTPIIMDDCSTYVNGLSNNWTLIAFINIIPFVCASFAFLRALIDCILVRWNTSLADTITDKKFPWLACLPISGPLVFGLGCVILLFAGVFKCVQIPVALIMGRYEMSDVLKRWGGELEELEMQGEEGRGLVEGMEGVGEEEASEGSDGPPAYDEVVREGGGEERREEGKGEGRNRDVV